MSIVTLPAAIFLDFLLGDPEGAPHPVRLMGKGVTFFEPVFRRLPFGMVMNGLGLALFLILLSLISSLAIIWACHGLHPALGLISEIILFYYCISIKSLKEAAMGVYAALKEEGLSSARDKLRWIVGREVDSLSQSGVSMAAVETVAENLVDGVIAPLFYGALFGAPFAVAYKMVNTLDSMVGYRNDTYIEFGKCAAKIDDAANYLPARFSLPVIALSAQILFKKGRAAFALGIRDGGKHKSPNSGIPEAAFAGALEIRVGGPNRYHGILVEKPYIGQELGEASPGHIGAAVSLMMTSAGLWALLLLVLTVLWGG
jgi:adenosylcobinamide-phosphate synthase